MRSVIWILFDRIIVVVLLISMLCVCVPDSGRTFEDGSVISDAELAGVRDLFKSRYSKLYSADAEGMFCPGDFSLQWEDAKKREGNSWTTGDKEFEAKVFDAVLYIDYGLYTGADQDEIRPLCDYYYNPSSLLYDEAIGVLRSPFLYGYSSADFPINASFSYSERIKHIR